MKKDILKEQLRPFYDGLLFLDLIFEETFVNQVKTLLKEDNSKDKVKRLLYKNGLIEEYNSLSNWMNWDVLTEGETFDPEDSRQTDYGVDPQIDGEDDSDFGYIDTNAKFNEFPIYSIYESNVEDKKIISIFKADSQEELIDFVASQSEILWQTSDPNEAKDLFFSFGGKKENFQIGEVEPQTRI